MKILEVENLSVAIPTPQGMIELISHVEFTLESGASIGIVGESGCGKSMTALSIMGLLPEKAQTCGKILWEGKNLLALDESQMRKVRGHQIAMIFQEPMTALNPVKTIGIQISEGLRLHLGKNKKDAEIKTTRLLDSVGLPVSRFPLNLYPHQLSGGQRQRVMIAMAIACGPDILIADEPTTALDVTVQEKILDLIDEIAEDSGMSLIMISHDLGIIAQTTDKMVVMYSGNCVESGTTIDVFQNMTHPYTYGLFASIPKPRGRTSVSKKPDDNGTWSDISAPRQRMHSIPGQVPEPHARPVGCNFADRCFKAKDDCSASPPLLNPIHGQHKVSCFHPLLVKEN